MPRDCSETYVQCVSYFDPRHTANDVSIIRWCDQWSTRQSSTIACFNYQRCQTSCRGIDSLLHGPPNGVIHPILIRVVGDTCLAQCRPHSSIQLNYDCSTCISPLHSLISVQPPGRTRSSSLITITRPPSSSSLKITNCSFRYASHACSLWNNLPASFRQPRSSFVTTITSHHPSLPSSLFHSRLKTHLFHKRLSGIFWNTTTE